MKIKNILSTELLFFTSDLHFYHEGIIKFCSRPFKNAEEMNKQLIINWNSVVPKNGIVIEHGDFAHTGDIEKIKGLLSQLNGTIYHLQGNHDYQNRYERQSIVNLFEGKVYDALDYTVYDKETNKNYNLHSGHYPREFWTRGAIHTFGHIHSGPNSTSNEVVIDKPMRYDVGIDNNDYKPISFRELLAKIVYTDYKKN